MTPDRPDALRVLWLVVDALERADVSYHLGGSYASSFHGKPRQTLDIDIVAEIDAVRAASLISMLRGDFYADDSSAQEAVARRESFNLIHMESGTKVDVFVRGDDPFDRAEFERHRPEAIDPESGRQAFVKSPEDTILRKLLWYRAGGEVSERQWLDVAGIVQEQGDRLDRPYLDSWANRLGLRDLMVRAFGGGS